MASRSDTTRPAPPPGTGTDSHPGPVVPYLVLGVSVLLTAAAALYVHGAASEHDRVQFERLVERTETSIQRRLDTYINLLRGCSGLFAASDTVEIGEFRAYVESLRLEEHYPGVQGIGVSLRFPKAFRERLLADLRRQPELANFTTNPDPPRDEHHAIVYLEPRDERNRKAIGYDMFTDPTRRAAMERARDTAAPALSAKVTLVQEDEQSPQPGFLIYLPLYDGGPVPQEVEARRFRLAGFVYSPFRAVDLFEGLFGGRTPYGLAFDVYDGTDVAPGALLYRSDADDPAVRNSRSQLHKRTRLVIAGQPWTIVFRTRPEFVMISSRGFTPLAVALGGLVSLMLFRISYGQYAARRHAESTADELRASEQALRASESKFRRLADSNLVGVAFADLHGRIIDANDALLGILGRSRAELERGAIEWDAITPPEFRDADARAVQQLRAKGVCAPYEKQYIRPDGSRVAVLIGSAMLEGQPGQAVGIVVDVTERNRALEELRAARDAADAARTEAEEASRLKDEFLATVSHELRTPLNAILGWAQILRDGACDTEEFSQGLATIERNARAQAQLVDDLLDVSRIVSGKLRLNVRNVELRDVIEAAIEAVRPAADAKGVRLERVLDPHTGSVLGDPDRLQQVVWNLLSNAVKFTPRGGTVQVLLQPSDGHAEIAVSDTGRGISREFLPYVFDRFRQADASITRQFGGLGLGLGIVRHLIELHGGMVAASSLGEGKGATFIVQLPLAQAAAQVEPAASAERRNHAPAAVPLPSEPPPLAGVRVLVVDDDPDSRALLLKILCDSGARVTVSGSAAEAVTAFTQERPDAIVSDIGMPDEDGYSLLRRLREMENGASVPAIALSALAREEDRRRALRAGFQVHLAKPIEPAEVRRAVADVLGRQT